MGNTPTRRATIRGREPSADLDTLLEEALRRIARLERIVAENRIEDTSILEAPKRTPGRPKGISDEELQSRAKSLVYWLEDNWPEIAHGLRGANDEHDVARVLKAGRRLGAYPFQPPFYKEPELYSGECLKFIRGKRYRHNPRNLAAAMAGVPEISGKTSFNRCSKYAANCIPVGYRAIRDYMRRNFNDRFQALTKASTTEEVVELLQGSRSKDRVLFYLRKDPEKVLYWLECGIPGTTHLNSDPTWDRR